MEIKDSLNCAKTGSRSAADNSLLVIDEKKENKLGFCEGFVSSSSEELSEDEAEGLVGGNEKMMMLKE